MSYVVLDFETTGLNYKREQVIEIAAIKLDDNLREIGSFNTFVRLYAHLTLPEFIANLTGITDEDLRFGMREDTAFGLLKKFIGVSTVVAQYAPFDLAYLAEQGLEPEQFICTKSITSQLEPKESSSLIPTCERLGISLDNAHRAIDDARATAELFRHRVKAQGVNPRLAMNTIVTTPGRPLSYIPPATKTIALKGSGELIADFSEVNSL
jgi:DNA polymerase III subunit epsilon